MQKSILIALAFLLIGTVLRADTPPDPVLDRLVSVEYFAFGPTGRGGVTTQGENDYKVVLERKTALQDFERLYSKGNLQGQCYALVGIRSLHLPRFAELSRTLANSKAEVVVRSGCSQMRIRLNLIVTWIAEGRYSQPLKKEKTSNRT